jgi:hypothetical protein
MDEKLFLQRLSEVSEWVRPQTGPNGAKSVNKRAKAPPEHPGPITEAELAEMTDTEAEQYYERLMAWRESQPNNSVPPEIKELKIQSTACEDCGEYCANGRRVESRLCVTGERHWRTRCQVCERYRDPATGLFTVTSQEVHRYFASYYRPKLGVYNSKHQPKAKTNTVVDARGQIRTMLDVGDSIIYSLDSFHSEEKSNNNK